LIDQTTIPLCDIAFAAGFRSVRRFNDTFRATYAVRRRRSAKRQSDIATGIEAIAASQGQLPVASF
jgi:AraC family transcriptional regulator of adaptative response / DNA-3-methyladenine glycosylase II